MPSDPQATRLRTTLRCFLFGPKMATNMKRTCSSLVLFSSTPAVPYIRFLRIGICVCIISKTPKYSMTHSLNSTLSTPLWLIFWTSWSKPSSTIHLSSIFRDFQAWCRTVVSDAATTICRVDCSWWELLKGIFSFAYISLNDYQYLDYIGKYYFNLQARPTGMAGMLGGLMKSFMKGPG